MTGNGDAFAALLRRQYGAVSRTQALQHVPLSEVDRFARKGWRRLHAGVYAQAEPTREQAWMAALLWGGPGAALSHTTAARIHGLDGVEDGPLELTLPPGRGAGRGTVRVHRTALPQEDIKVINGLQVTTAPRTLIDLAAVLEPVPLAMAVESAWRGKLSLAWVEKRLRKVGTNGRRGTRALRRILDDCWERKHPLDSALEVRLWWQLKASSLALPIPGYEFRDGGHPGRLDFAYPEQRLAIETDGYAVHGPRAAFERDRARLSRLAAAGWRVLHVTWAQLDEPKRVERLIANALANDSRWAD